MGVKACRIRIRYAKNSTLYRVCVQGTPSRCALTSLVGAHRDVTGRIGPEDLLPIVTAYQLESVLRDRVP